METNHCVLHVFFCISLCLVLWDSSLACHTGSQAECEKAPFVPGYNLAGEGFDLVKMRRKGAFLINVKSYSVNGTCTICKNRFHGDQMQKLPSAVLDWRIFSTTAQPSTALHHSVDSLMKSSTSLINNNWKVDLRLDDTGKVIFGGSRSDIAQFAHSQSAKDKTTFALHEISCTYYSYRLRDHPELSTEFSKHLQTLPTQYDDQSKHLYQKMIETYGTHYIRQVHLGGRVRWVTAFRTCLATLKGFSEIDIKHCLNMDFMIKLGFQQATASFSNKCSKILVEEMGMGFYQTFMTHKTEVLGGEKYFPELVLNQSPAEAYSQWRKSLHDNPDVISYAIFPLHHLVADPEVSANLKRAVTQYIEENAISIDHKEYEACSKMSNLDQNCCPLRAGRGTLVVFMMGATGMNEDYFSSSDGYVKAWYNGIYKETEVILDNNDPDWNTNFNFGSVEFGHQLKFEVWDSDVNFDDFVGECVISPESGMHIHRCKLQRGFFYFIYRALCDDHLTGPRCSRYSPEL
nr:perforin 8b [Danio rerio]